MRRLIRWIARFYPAQWRERYGEELDALIEDIQPEWQDLFNVLLGALRMQMTTRNSLKILGAVTLAGALAAGVLAFRTPDRYVSTAVMRITPADSDRQRALDRLAELQQKANQLLSRDKALRIRLVQAPGGRGPAFVISCDYPDKLKAQAVVRELVSSFAGEKILEILDRPSLPQRPIFPNRPMIVTVGLLGGAVLGLLAVLVRRSTLHSQKT
jgi:LPS O-antigen subunit length determinant protein (WzzB/FepE family)